MTQTELQTDMTTPIAASDTTAPTVSLTAPAAGANLSGTVSVTAAATDNVAVAGVQFKLDGANLSAEDTISPYSVSWITTTAPNGSHTLTAVARDAAGNTTTAAVVSVTVSNGDVTPPTVSLTAPAAGATVSGTIAVSATAADNVAVAGVQFKLDGVNLSAEDTTSPYSVNWTTTTAPNGSHSLTAVARDAAGNTTTSGAQAVTVSTAAPPPPPSANLVAAYAYNEGAGTAAADASPSANGATLTSATWSSGQFSSGLSFSGTAYVNAPDINALTPGTGATFEAWVFLTSTPTELASIFNKWGLAAEDEYLLALDPNRRPFFAWHTTGGSTYGTTAYNEATDAGQVPLNTWTHVAVVRTGTLLNFYINGTLSSSVTALDANPFRNGTNSLRVGGQNRGANRNFPGRIDEARIYNRALTQPELQTDMTTPIASGSAGQLVTWTSLVNSTAWVGRLRKTGGCDGCTDAAALSVERIESGNGYLELVATANQPRRYIGFGTGSTSTSTSNLRHGLRLDGGTVEVRESGTWKYTTTIQTGDVLRIAVSNNVVTYLKNGTVFYTSTKTPTYPLVVDTALIGMNAEFEGVVISGIFQ